VSLAAGWEFYQLVSKEYMQQLSADVVFEEYMQQLSADVVFEEYMQQLSADVVFEEYMQQLSADEKEFYQLVSSAAYDEMVG
jgi:predicted nucleotidyltransferase